MHHRARRRGGAHASSVPPKCTWLPGPPGYRVSRSPVASSGRAAGGRSDLPYTPQKIGPRVAIDVAAELIPFPTVESLRRYMNRRHPEWKRFYRVISGGGRHADALHHRRADPNPA